MERIESKDNLIIKETKKLKDKKSRLEQDKFLVEGFRFVGEALVSSFEVSSIFISDAQLERWKNYNIEEKLQKSTKVYLVKDKIFESLCSTDTPQGIVAVVSNKNVGINNSRGFYILTDKIQDPGNMGTIIRTAHAAGALGVIITSGTVDVYNEKTLRATMGAIFNIPIIEDKNLAQVKILKENGFKLVASSLDTEKNFYEANLTEKVIIAVGNEGNGISEEIIAICDEKVKIPMPGNAESLNVAIAASVMMFETVRQNLT